MKETPILFSTDMVQAILNGTKTQTRRAVAASNTTGFSVKKSRLDFTRLYDNGPFGVKVEEKNDRATWRGNCKWQKGDVLYVRESWAEAGNMEGSFYANSEVIAYRTQHAHFYKDGIDAMLDTKHWNWDKIKWKPSIHMPKAAARIWLEITDVRVERLHDISSEDCIKEGIRHCYHEGDLYYFYPCNDLRDDSWLDVPKTSFYSLWRSINGEESWQKNPWVWAISFKVLSTTGKPLTIKN